MKNKFQLKDEQIIIDPGIGFGKTKEDNYLILDNINKFKQLGFPVLIGLFEFSSISTNFPLTLTNIEENFALAKN